MKTTNKETQVLKGSIIFLMLSALFMTTFLFTSCSDNTENTDVEDEALIAAIETSVNRTAISVTDLPPAAQADLSRDYKNDEVYEVSKAEGLGFELRLITTEGSFTSELNSVFFTLRGRQLENRGRPRHGPRRSCFKVLFPFSLTMPDGTIITLEDRSDRALVRAWYQENPGVTEKPNVVFPIEIEYQDGTVATINSQN